VSENYFRSLLCAEQEISIVYVRAALAMSAVFISLPASAV